MITAEELKNLADDELDALSADVERELTRRKNRRTREAIRTAKKILAAAGFDVQLIPLGSSPPEKQTEPNKPKAPSVRPGRYQNPDNPNEEWVSGGRGRMPKWVRDLLAEGANLDQYRVEVDAEADAI